MNAYIPVNRVAQYAEDSKELIDEYPVMTVAIVFGLGVVTGLAAVALLSESPQPTSRYSQVAHRLGEQLIDAMSSVAPGNVTSLLRRH